MSGQLRLLKYLKKASKTDRSQKQKRKTNKQKKPRKIHLWGNKKYIKGKKFQTLSLISLEK